MNPDSIDNQIQTAIKADDPAALELIWEHYADDMFAFLQGMLCSRHDAEDALQQIFVKLARLRGRLLGVKNLRAYLFQITRNEAADLIKKQSRHKSGTYQNDPWLIPKSESGISDEQAARIRDTLSDLPREQRLVIMLKIYRLKTFKEIAELLGISQNTAASRYRYGIQRLQTLLHEH